MGIIHKEKKIGLALLCDNTPYTLSMTLASFRRSGLLGLMDEVCGSFQEGAVKVRDELRAFDIREVPLPDEHGFFTAMRETVEALDTDYVLLIEGFCPVWEHLYGAPLKEELARSLQWLVDGEADLVRLRHSWRGSARYKAAHEYSYFYPVEQLSSQWLHAESLSDSPSWVKTLRRLLHPQRARRSIGRCVYVEQSPHLRFPEYIRKLEKGMIIDSEVFEWTNQPTLISRKKMIRLLDDLSGQGSVGQSPEDFEYAVNRSSWRKHHLRIGVGQGIFT
jgi:hypothetical protein